MSGLCVQRMDGLCFCADGGLLFLFLRRLAGTRPGGRLTFLPAQESQQRRRAGAAFAPQNSLRAALRRCARTTAVSQTGGGLPVLAAVPGRMRWSGKFLRLLRS